MSTALPTRPLGRTGLTVGPICIGTSPLASMSRLYGYDVSDARAIDTVEAVLASSIDFIDTSNGYGEDGAAERRVGAAIAAHGGLPEGVLLATKVDPDPVSGDFSGDRVRRSFEESLERLGVDRIELLHLHDPERIPFEQAVAPGGPVEAMIRLRDEGVVGHLGVAGGPVGVMQAYLDTGAFEVVLTNNRYTLLDRSAEDLFARAHDAGVGVLNAAPYGGGMLAKGPDQQRKYAYGERDDRIAESARRMAAACAAAGVPLAAAALQFSTRARFVDSTVVGVSRPERVAETIDAATLDIPTGLWDELARLAPPRDTWLDG
jgi:D-threo-aldose 1-dehydrogenase